MAGAKGNFPSLPPKLRSLLDAMKLGAARGIVPSFARTLTIGLKVVLLVFLEWFLIWILELNSEIADTIWQWTRNGAAVIVSLAFLRDLVRILFV